MSAPTSELVGRIISMAQLRAWNLDTMTKTCVSVLSGSPSSARISFIWRPARGSERVSRAGLRAALRRARALFVLISNVDALEMKDPNSRIMVMFESVRVAYSGGRWRLCEIASAYFVTYTSEWRLSSHYLDLIHNLDCTSTLVIDPFH